MYRIVPTPEVLDQIAAMPVDLLTAFADVTAVLEVTPWNGRIANNANPESWMRSWIFGPQGNGHLVYMVVEDRSEVHLLRVQWIERESQ